MDNRREKIGEIEWTTKKNTAKTVVVLAATALGAVAVDLAAATGQCTTLFAATVARSARCRSSPLRAGRFTAATASGSTGPQEDQGTRCNPSK